MAFSSSIKSPRLKESRHGVYEGLKDNFLVFTVAVTDRTLANINQIHGLRPPKMLGKDQVTVMVEMRDEGLRGEDALH